MEAFEWRKRVVKYGLVGAGVVVGCSALGERNDWAAVRGPAYWLVMVLLASLGVGAYVLRDWLRWLEDERTMQRRALDEELSRLRTQQAILDKEAAKTGAERSALREASCEIVAGMPALNQLLTSFFKMQDGVLIRELHRENRAYKAADIVKEQTALRRAAEQQCRHLQAKVELYEALDPLLKECGEEVPFDPKQSQLATWIRKEVTRLNYKLSVREIELKEREERLYREADGNYQQRWKELQIVFAEHARARENEQNVLARTLTATQQEREVLRAVTRTRTAALPALLALLDELAQAADREIVATLTNKANPARTTAERVREEAARRREAEKNARYLSVLVEYYENLAPFLMDFREELTAERSAEEEARWFEAYSDEEREDLTTKFLTKEEYRKLTPSQRSDKALQRYWARPHSPQEIGRMYERYVGYLYEVAGFRVEYHGILYGKEDLGRDLLCYGPDGRTRVVQCKWWSQHKTIHEKHLFQLYGSLFLYERQLQQQGLFEAQGVFVTTTQLSEVAREAARFLRIEVQEQKPMDKGYPCIKCNVSRTGEKIYHLPFDQQYDKTRIIPKNGEMYCKTAAEAEKKGFRRALRYRPEA